MSGGDRLNRRHKPARLKRDLSIIWVVLFAVAGVVISLAFSHFDASIPVQLLAP
jgi:hypothetical protein